MLFHSRNTQILGVGTPQISDFRNVSKFGDNRPSNLGDYAPKKGINNSTLSEYPALQHR